MDMTAALDALVAQLEAGGVRAVVDARDVNPPCVLLRAPTLTFRFGKGYADAAFAAWCVVGDTGRRTSLDAVNTLIQQTQAALDYLAVDARPDDAILPDGSTLPIYVLTWTQRLPL